MRVMAASDESMLTQEELRLGKQKRRRLVLLLAFVLVLGVTGFLLARPTRNAIKGWQARRHAAKAFALIDEAKWNDAKNEAVAAYQLRPTEPQALRAVARFLSRTRQQQALEFWDQLAKQQSLTRQDLRDEAAAALATGELDRATAAVDSLLTNDGKEATPHDWLLAAQLQLQRGAADKALDSLGHLFARPEASPLEQLQATIMQLQAAHTGIAEVDAKNQREAWERLEKLAERDDEVGLNSLVLLAQRQLALKQGTESGKLKAETSNTDNSDSALPTPSFHAISESQLSDVSFMKPDELIHRLQVHPLAKAPQKLLAIDLQLQAHPEQRDALIARAIADWKNADASQVAVLATWLNGKGEYQRLLDEIPVERALQSRDLFLQDMDALGALGRWEEIQRLLETERFPLDPVQQRTYLARCSAQLGNEAAAKNNWQRALEAAAGDVGKLMQLAEYAEKNGAADIAVPAYEQATLAAPKLRQAWQGRLRTTYAGRDTKRIHQVLAEMLKLWPNDTSIQNDEAYTRLLLLPNDPNNQELITLEQLGEALVAKEPSSLPHRTLLALALLKQGRPVAALQVYDGIQVAGNALTPSALAVHAGVLAANGNAADARNEIAHVPSDRLLPEEKAGTANLRESP